MFNITKKKIHSVSVHKNLVIDGRLSPFSKGLFMYLNVLKDDFEITNTHILKYNNCGITSVLTGIKELQAYGYITIREEGKKKYFELNDNPDKSDFHFKAKSEKKKVRDIAAEKAKFVEKAKEVWDKIQANPKYKKHFPYPELIEFIRYWSEISTMKKDKKMRYEYERTFEISRRMATWVKSIIERKTKGRI